MEIKGTPLELGTENIGKLLKKYAIPAIIAMIATSLYNITDSIFIGHGVGPLAISGLAITFPLMNLAAAFGSLVGVGASTLLSVRLGQKDYDTANSILGNVFVMNLIIGIAFTIITLLFLTPILYFFGASEKTIPYAHDFMVIILLGNVVTHTYLGLNSMLRSAGKPKQSMYATIYTVIINLILNPLFIFVFNWGIKGSALATVISQIMVLAWQIYLFSDKNNFIHLQKGIFKLKRRIVKDSLAIGMSPFLMNAAASVIISLINHGLLKYGGNDFAVGAYGIVNRIAFLFVMIVLGLNQGMQPIAGYNYGAGLYPRVTKVLKQTILWATVVMTIGFIIIELVPHAVASVFTTDDELIDTASTGLRIVFFCYPVVGFQIVVSAFFQSIGMAKKAILLSLTRQVFFLIPCLFILPRFFGISGIWMSMPLADLFAIVLASVMLYVQSKEFKKQQSD
ncbi:MAG: MATE family efflux transporter [Flavobacteriaceae bacterium]|jgi:putative MATE family efflux protein|nr:MATE family efflux transporter [Flavobacteriaceae bacterium]